MRHIAPWLLFAVSIVVGVAIFAAGFRFTNEVTVVLAATVLVGGALGFARPDRAWLWGLALGLGTRISDLAPRYSIFHEPPLPPEHLAKYGSSQPLPLPLGLMANPLAERVGGSLLIMAFPVVGACLGWMLRKSADWLTRQQAPN